MRTFEGYRSRGAPHDFDDGTLAPWAVAAALPFAPDIVVPTLERYEREWSDMFREWGLSCSFNPTARWVSKNHFAIDQGPVVEMIENHRTGLLWQLGRKCEIMARGLERAGFA